MATRLAEPEPWCRVSEVLARAAGADESAAFDTQAREVARQMRGIRFDWAGRPTCTWSAAAELLASLKAEQARKWAQIEERAIAADAAFRNALPRGIPASQDVSGVSAIQMAMAADRMDQEPRRESMVAHALGGGGIIFHPVNEDAAP